MLQDDVKDSILGFKYGLGPYGFHGNVFDIGIGVKDGNDSHTPEQKGKKEAQVVIVIDGPQQHGEQDDKKQ